MNHNLKFKKSKMTEQYIVKFNYKKQDGFWVIGEEIEIDVEYNAENEKDNHDKAREKIYRIYHGCEVVSINYC
jgi:hypothetical protein